jgi:hypothetical protein
MHRNTLTTLCALGGVVVGCLLMLAFGFRMSHRTPETAEEARVKATELEAARVKAIQNIADFDMKHSLVREYVGGRRVNVSRSRITHRCFLSTPAP